VLVPENLFVGEIARTYDQPGSVFAPEVLGPTVDCLAELAGEGPCLEFAIGTGRVAVPLAGRGIQVAGIDISADMLAELRAKPEAVGITTVEGDMATTLVDGQFSLVYLVFNTISNLTTQDEQVDCFRNAAAHLAPGGCFVVELGVPDLRRFPPGAVALPFHVSPEHLGFDTIDVASQRGVSHHYVIDRDRVAIFDTPYRYAWPAELDLMARIAGLEPRERWADWDRTPFTSESGKHISVWQRPGMRAPTAP
jgi:SAM-dependent methyltransferase